MPYIVAIWAYERARRYFVRKDHRWQSKSQSQRPIVVEHISYSSRKAGSTGFPAVTQRSDSSLVKVPNPERPGSAGAANDLSDLKQMILKLSTQVEELTSRLDSQR
ncbi:hypothetical protein MMC06_004290 [Schaereria dolodes]|nr:hypothetical protein [Schaereria dolodes]